MKQIYLAARYSRREELCEYRKELQSLGYFVQSRWLDGQHQISDTGAPIGDHGEALVESNHPDADTLRTKFALDDWEDVTSADIVISFTEPPRSSANRGGRHVEYGIALANGSRLIIVGYKENIFHWLPSVEFYHTWEDARKGITA
jgi:nucleoside 2-deoxyribosyltransferase